ncbi:unnamed protein product [Calypogeia fissa]
MQGHPSFDARNGRSADKYKAPLKEKFVSLYEEIFAGRSLIHTAKDQGVQGRAALTRFWDDLLLLKVNDAFLSQFIAKASEEQLRGELKPIINGLFETYSMYLGDGNFIRVAHALETLTILLREIFKKRFTEQGYTIITLVCRSVEQSDSFFRRLVTSIASLLSRDDVPVLVKSLGLRVFLTILIATDNVNTNSIASYLFVNNIFDALIGLFNLKISSDRKKIELDASLVLILLLLWRESANPYVERLSATGAPVVPLLHTILSLLSLPPKLAKVNESPNSLASPLWSNAEGVFGYLGSWFGFTAPSDSTALAGVAGTTSALGSEVLDLKWCNSTAALILIYFLCYLNPALKSTQLWPSSDFSMVQGPPGNSAPALWIQVLKSFLSLSKDILTNLPTTGAPGVLRGKLCLTVLRCIAEDHVSAEFLSRADAESFTLNQVPVSSLAGIPSVVPFRSLSCVIVDLGTSVLVQRPDGAVTDPDLCHRAALLIPIVLNHLRSRGWQLLPTSINWLGMWQGLAETCTRCAPETAFQRPGVPELAELTLGIIESCLGNSQDLCASPDETDRLHAMVMAHMSGFEQLVRTASSTPFGDGGKSATRGGIRIVNISSVKFQYEVQIAALGVRGQPTFEQALLGVRKKGLANLKLKHSYAGPGHSYTEGTVEHRILINLVRLLVSEHRQRLTSSGTLKLELETKKNIKRGV